MPGTLTLAADGHFMANAFTLVQLAGAAYADDPGASTYLTKTVFSEARTFSHQGTDTFGFVTGNEDHVVISFRGTVSIKNWLSNIDMRVRGDPIGKVHNGFAVALDAVWDAMKKHVDRLRDHGQRTWLTGHSLGGALAALATRWLEQGYKHVATCTYGQPRCGDISFANGFTKLLYRFVNNQDIVPTVPSRFVPAFWNFRPVFYSHVGALKFFDADGKLVEEDDTDQPLGALPVLIELLGPTSDAEAEAADLIAQGISDHGIANYVRLVEQNLP